MISSKKWIALFLAFVVMIMSIIGILGFCFDPYMQFRVRDNTYLLNGRFVCAGLIKNYEYDSLIIGSSMTHNFNMNVFRDNLGGNPLHIALGGITPKEINDLVQLSYGKGKANHYYLCVDLSLFTDDRENSQIPNYLLNYDILSMCRYLFSYEIWFRYIPADIGLIIMDQLQIDLPLKYKYSRSIDRLEDTSLDYAYGKNIVINNYINNQFAVSEVDTDSLFQRMKEHIDDYLANFDFSGCDYTFFFPPYSSLFWLNAQEKGYYDTYIMAKKYFVDRVSSFDNVTVYDFQCVEEVTSNLDNYRDTNHYCPSINDWMIRCFANKEYIITSENYSAFNEELDENIKRFRKDFSLLIHND